MDSKINLLSKKETIHKEVRRVIIASISIFSVIFIITLGIVLLNLFRNMEYNRLQSREDELRSQINQQAEKRDSILKLHDRLSTIENLLKSRKLVDARFAVLTDLIPDSISFSEVSITAAKIAIRLQATNLSDYNSVLDTFYKLDEDQELKKNLPEVTKIEVTNFNASSQEGVYALELNFEYGRAPKQ